ncbi:unnamed protein product, partial [Ixodes persulcatus]
EEEVVRSSSSPLKEELALPADRRRAAASRPPLPQQSRLSADPVLSLVVVPAPSPRSVIEDGPLWAEGFVVRRPLARCCSEERPSSSFAHRRGPRCPLDSRRRRRLPLTFTFE